MNSVRIDSDLFVSLTEGSLRVGLPALDATAWERDLSAMAAQRPRPTREEEPCVTVG